VGLYMELSRHFVDGLIMSSPLVENIAFPRRLALASGERARLTQTVISKKILSKDAKGGPRRITCQIKALSSNSAPPSSLLEKNNSVEK